MPFFLFSVGLKLCDYEHTHVAGDNCKNTYRGTKTMCLPALSGGYFNPEIQPMEFIRGNGNGGGGSTNPTPPYSGDYTIITQPQLTLSEAALFSRSLSATQKVFWNNTANATVVAQLKNYLNSKNYSSESKSFVKNICDFQIATSNTTLTNKLLTLANNDLESAQQIIDYLSNEGNSEASQTFATWATTYYQSHPDTTAQQFNNWFMGESEGQDGNYDAAYWENPNLSFPQQNLPTFAAFSAAYPSHFDNFYDTPQKMYSRVGGRPLEIFNSSQNGNTCALRVSKALNYSGVTIPNLPNKTFLGDDNKYYFLSAASLLSWMKKTFGIPSGDNHLTTAQGGINGQAFSRALQGKQGVYIMIPINAGGCQDGTGFCASGHADLIDNSTCDGSCYYNAKGGVKDIYIWQLN